jgi:RNA polymerase sigma-70 factor (ECF subfamily)
MQQSQFKNMILIHKDAMYRLALRMLRNEEDAQDIVQDSLIKLWNKRKVLEDIRSYKSFALTIIRNACIDLIRKRKPETNQQENLEYRDGINPEKQLDISDQLKLAKQIINQLNQQQRELIQLRDMEELSYEEISEITGLTINTIRVNISRGRKEIRQKMMAIMNFKRTEKNAV